MSESSTAADVLVEATARVCAGRLDEAADRLVGHAQLLGAARSGPLAALMMLHAGHLRAAGELARACLPDFRSCDAELLAQMGLAQQARALAAQQDPDEPPLVAIDRLLELGHFDLALDRLERLAQPQAWLRLARLSLWRADLDGARAYLRMLEGIELERESQTELILVRAGVALLAGQQLLGWRLLDEAARRGAQGDRVAQWRLVAMARGWVEPRALLPMSVRPRAYSLSGSPGPATLAQMLLLRRVGLALVPGLAGTKDYEYQHGLALLREAGAELPADPSPTRASLRRALACYGGNMGPNPTARARGAPGGLAYVPAGGSARLHTSQLQHSLLWAGMEGAQRALEQLADQLPSSPFPRTYLGELQLWEGRYEQALATLEGVWQEHHQKWAGVGSGAALMFLGRERQAARRWRATQRWTRELPGETTWAYLGELHWRRGRSAQAIAQLQRSVDARPDRVGGWWMLARVAADSGAHELAARARVRLWTLAPGLCREAAARVGQTAGALERTRGRALSSAALEAGHEMLRGNRSSFVLTWYGEDGEMRVMRTNAMAQLRGLFTDYRATLESLGLAQRIAELGLLEPGGPS